MIGSTPSQNDDSLSIASERGANAGSMRGAQHGIRRVRPARLVGGAVEDYSGEINDAGGGNAIQVMFHCRQMFSARSYRLPADRRR